MFTTALVQSGQFRVVERSRVNEGVVREKQLQQAGWATGLFRTRAAFGEPKPQFGFAAQSAPNLYTAALSQHKDLHIADSAADKVRASLPDWFARDFTQAKSFLLMPLVVGDKLVGFFYADRPMVDAAGLSAQELNLLRALRSQVVLALRSR